MLYALAHPSLRKKKSILTETEVKVSMRKVIRGLTVWDLGQLYGTHA